MSASESLTTLNLDHPSSRARVFSLSWLDLAHTRGSKDAVKRTAGHHTSDDTLLRNKARALSKTRPASTSAIHSRSWRSADTKGGALRVFCAGATLPAPRESLKQLKASVDAVAARHGLGPNPETGGLQDEQDKVPRRVGSILIPTL